MAAAQRLAEEIPLPSSVGWDLHRAAETLGTNGHVACAAAACELGLRIAGDDQLLRAALLEELSVDAEDRASADGAMAAVRAAHARNPEGVAVEWRHQTGFPFPAPS